jgi:DivIVA domain-containing protein
VISPADNRLTPDVVQGVAFPPARIGRRGLDEEHVRAFCAQVERELVRLLNEKASLGAEVQRLRRRVLGLSGSEGSVEHQRNDANLQAVRILSEAQQIADRYVADAQAYSERLAAEAQRRRDELIAEARSRAEVLLEQAQQAIRFPAPWGSR